MSQTTEQRTKERRLARYMETGMLPHSQYLTPEQCKVIIHAPAERSNDDLAAALGVDAVSVKYYRWLVHGSFSCRIHIQRCIMCGVVFVTDQSRQFMHPECRADLNARWEPAADLAA